MLVLGQFGEFVLIGVLVLLALTTSGLIAAMTAALTVRHLWRQEKREQQEDRESD